MMNLQSGNSPLNRCASYKRCYSDENKGLSDVNRNTDSVLNPRNSASASSRRNHEIRAFAPPKVVTRKRKRGSPFTPAEFWQYVERRGLDECWPWLDTVLARNGYGMFWHPVLKRTLPAHRVAWLLTHGEIPRGFEIMHTCDNPLCQNVERHMQIGTHRQNMQDMAAKGRSGSQWTARRTVKHWTSDPSSALRCPSSPAGQSGRQSTGSMTWLR